MSGSPETKRRILVLDCDHKNALAIIRHLGRTKQYVIDGASYHKASIGFYSRYLEKKHLIARPKREPEKYINDLLHLVKTGNYDVLLPVSYISYQLCAHNAKAISKHVHLTLPGVEQIELASSKSKTYQLAEEIGLPYPAVYNVNSEQDLVGLEVNFPCVIKAPFEAGKNIVEYAKDKEELIRKFRSVNSAGDFKGEMPIVQDYIKGGGFGFFAYYKEGKCIQYFMHKRIREYPVKGGASTVAESFYDETLKEYGSRILDHLKWNGIAMVEFKRNDETGIYYLMEINAKFWGSLDLALVCGVNFPQMLIDNSENKTDLPVKENSYHKMRFQWILNGDLLHVLERPWHILHFFRDLFLAKNDFWFRDLAPNLFQLFYIPLHYYKKWFK